MKEEGKVVAERKIMGQIMGEITGQKGNVLDEEGIIMGTKRKVMV